MRYRDDYIFVYELRQQLIPGCRSRSLVDVENRGNLGMLQLNALCMDDIAPKEDFLSLRREFIAGMSRCMASQWDELHPVDDRFGAAKRVPLTSLDIRAAIACALWKKGCASFGALAAISGDSQKSLSAFAT